MQRLNIFHRISLGYFAILVVVVIFFLYTLSKFTQLHHIATSLSSVDSPVLTLCTEMQDLIQAKAEFERKFFVSKDDDFYMQFKELKQQLWTKRNELANLVRDSRDRELFKSFITATHAYHHLVQQEYALITSNTKADTGKFFFQKRGLVNDSLTHLDRLRERTKARMQDKIATSNSIGLQAGQVTIMAVIFILGLGLLIGAYITRTINRPVHELMKGTARIAEGEFTHPLHITSPPEIKQLAQSFNTMAAKLHELDQMKAEFISHVSHELRTPLTAIREASCLLVYHRHLPPARERDLLEIIQEECERLIQSVDSILDLSRLESGMMDYHCSEHVLASLVEKSLSKMQPIASRKHIRLKQDIPETLPPVLVDGGKFDQVVLNLLGNALKYTPCGGKITVSAAYTSSEGIHDSVQDMITISVIDTGCGISRDHIAGIFERFRKGRGKGTGLGLSIAKHFVQAHGGEIWAESEEGHGSAFYFTVPVALSSGQVRDAWPEKTLPITTGSKYTNIGPTSLPSKESSWPQFRRKRRS